MRRNVTKHLPVKCADLEAEASDLLYGQIVDASAERRLYTRGETRPAGCGRADREGSRAENEGVNTPRTRREVNNRGGEIALREESRNTAWKVGG